MKPPKDTLIEDANGRVVKQLDPMTLYMLFRNEPIDYETLTAIVNEIEPGKAGLRRFNLPVVLALASLAIVCIIVVPMFVPIRQSMLRTTLSVVSLLALLATAASWRSAREKRREVTRFAMLKHKRCPHCGYDLRGNEVDCERHTITCGECGCVWLGDQDEIGGVVQNRPEQLTPQAERLLLLLLVVVLVGLGLSIARNADALG